MLVVINLFACLAICFIIIWFWGKRRKSTSRVQSGVVQVLVEGGVYIPSEITAKVGIPLTLRFLRKDPTGCADQVVFNNLDIQHPLPLNQSVDIVINHDQPGTYPFSCAMGMYQGSLKLIK